MIKDENVTFFQEMDMSADFMDIQTAFDDTRINTNTHEKVSSFKQLIFIFINYSCGQNEPIDIFNASAWFQEQSTNQPYLLKV